MRSGVTQSTPTAAPHVRVTIGADTYHSEGGNGGIQERVVSIKSDEQVWGGQYEILLDNSDEALNSKEYEGSGCYIYWGFVGETGSTQGTLWVDTQELVSQEGKLLMRLILLDALGMMSRVKGVEVGLYWNYPWQDPDVLAESVMPTTQAPIPADLITKISGQWDKTIQEIVIGTMSKSVNLPIDWTDLAEDTSLTTEKPTVSANDPRSLIVQAMNFSKSYLLWKSTNRFTQITPDAHASVYSYSVSNTFFSSVEERTHVIPNRIVVWYIDKTDPNAWVWNSKESVDAASYSKLGIYIDEHHNLERDMWDSLTASEAQSKADSRMAKLQMSKATGTIIAPMHCSQELYDAVTLVDDRYTTPKSITGYVFRLIREYSRGVYRIVLQLGGVESGYTPDGGGDIRVETPSPLPPSTAFPDIDWSTILPQAVQGYHHDITFSATDWDTVAWTSVNGIKFYDGTTQAISAGNTGNLATAAIYYIYFDLDAVDPKVLKVATSYMSVMTTRTGLVCLVQRGSTSSIKATFIPSYGKEPLITADFIDMTGLKSYDYGSGATLQAILSTQIQAGTIKISSATTFNSGYNPSTKAEDDFSNVSTTYKLRTTQIDGGYIKLTLDSVKSGEWYNESGVEIDASHGINLYGTDQALTTRATKTGTIQCKVDSSGNIVAGAGAIVINAAGIRVDGEGNLTFTRGSGYTTGGIGSISTSIMGIIANYKMRLAGGTGSSEGIEVVGCNGTSSGFRPAADNYTDLGLSGNRWKNFWCVTSNVGDLVFANNWKLTESKDGIILTRPDGTIAHEWR